MGKLLTSSSKAIIYNLSDSDVMWRAAKVNKAFSFECGKKHPEQELQSCEEKQIKVTTA